jgi:AraC-like DNA-binding protein
VERLTALAVACTDEPAFGLVWGERSPMFGFDVIGLVFGNAPSLRAGLDVVLRCQAVLGSHPELNIDESATRTRICFRPMSRTELVARVRAELAMTGLVRLLRQGRSCGVADLVRVDFAHEKPPYHREYTRIFGDLCRFERDETALVIDRSVLDRPSPTANVELHGLLVAQAERLLQRAREASSLAEQLRTQVRALLPRLPTMEDAAKGLGMSARSLRRRLREEGISFTRIVQDSQRALAELLLIDSGRTIQQIAGEAGFTSTTAFHRAFRRWTGESPQSYRERSGAR